MMPACVRRGGFAFRFGAGLVFVAGLCTGCAASFALPEGCEANAPPSTSAALKACVDALNFSTLEAAGDDQVLTIVDTNGQGSPCPGPQNPERTCRYGPRAMIQPEVDSWQVGYSELQKGRIIARLFIPEGQTQDYDSLGLVRGATTYWWVRVTVSEQEFYAAGSGDSLYPGKVAGKWEHATNPSKVVVGKSVFVSDRGGQIFTKERDLYYRRHEGQFKQALARWVWDPDDETAQGSCSKGCCR